MLSTMAAADEGGVQRVIRRRDGKFYAGPGKWVERFEKAKRFKSFIEIVQEGVEHQLCEGGCEVVLRFEDTGRFDVRFPLRSSEDS